MKKIGNHFQKIGTNPQKYLDNYQEKFLNINMQDELIICKENFTISHNQVELISFSSDATFRQNIDCWVSFGLFIRKNEKLIKIFDDMNNHQFYEHLKGIIFVNSNIESINIYRNTILIKLINLMGLEVIEKFQLKCRTKNITKEDVTSETGIFEKKIINDECLRKFLSIILENNNE